MSLLLIHANGESFRKDGTFGTTTDTCGNMGQCISSSVTSVASATNVIEKKIETADKTGILSLNGQNLHEIPKNIFKISTLKNLDISNNSLINLPSNLAIFTELKSLHCEKNQFHSQSINVISQLQRLQIFSAGNNYLGLDSSLKIPSSNFPLLPEGLRQLKLSQNHFSSIPVQITSKTLLRLEKLDLSGNQLTIVPTDISNLIALIELNLDDNLLQYLPESMGSLSKLKALSLQHNKIQISCTRFSEDNPQPIPACLFISTPLIDLKLKGNLITNTQLNELDGFPVFLNRLTDVKTKKLYGGAFMDYSLCGLE